jgi:PAS domain S-box-containing protein
MRPAEIAALSRRAAALEAEVADLRARLARTSGPETGMAASEPGDDLAGEHDRALFDTLDAGFCIVEVTFAGGQPVDYRFLAANPAFARQTGLGDAVGRWMRDLAPDHEQHWFDTYGRVALTGAPVRFESLASALEQRWFDVHAFRIGRPEQRRVAILFNDISARRSAELRAAANERELRLVTDALPVLIAFIDRDLIYRFANAAYRDWFDRSPDQVVGRDVRALLDPQGYAARRAAIERALAGEEVRFELPWPRRDGGSRDAEIRYLPRRAADGSVDGFHVFVQDITDRKRVEELLSARAESLEREVQARTRERNRLWETSNDLIGTAGLDGFLKAVNPAWTQMLGWSEAELLARPFLDIVDPADHGETAVVVARLGRGETVSGFVDRVRARDGQDRTIMWTAVPEPDTALFYIVGRDLTDQHRAEEQLRQAQKMEAVGQLTGGIAHDFNNLLTGISGSLELLQARMAQGRLTELDRYINAAQGASKRAAALTHRLLAFSRRQTLDPKPTDVNRLVSGMTELIRRTVGPAIEIEVVVAAGLWPILVDPPQLENALLNLCINARDAMPDGGRITIETANSCLDARAARDRDLHPGPYVSLCVTDTGTGMTAEVIKRAFDPFFTTKPLGQGTGLGLSMIYGFVRQSGGQVRIASGPGEGTTMCLELPRHHGATQEADGLADLAGAPRAEQGETVLIVDDEPSVRMLVTEVLEDLGYTAIEAADGPAGLSVLQSDVRIDLLVTDVGLPGGMNGRQVADAGRAVRPNLKILFITGYAENAAIGNGHLEPGMQVLTKPFAMEALAARIRELIAST